MKTETRSQKAARAAVYLLRVLGPVNCAKIAMDSQPRELVRIKIRLTRAADCDAAYLVTRIRRQADMLEAGADLLASFVCRIAADQVERAFT